MAISVLVVLLLYWVFRPIESNPVAPRSHSVVAPAAKTSGAAGVPDLMAAMDPSRQLRASVKPITPSWKLLVPPSYLGRTYREAVERLATDASPEGALVALQWSFYCFGMNMFRDPPNVPLLYPMPLVYSPRVFAAQRRRYEAVLPRDQTFNVDWEAVVKAAKVWEASLAEDEKPRAVALDPVSQAERKRLLDAERQGCEGIDDKDLQVMRTQRLKAVREDDHPMGEIMRARNITIAEGDEQARSERMRSIDNAMGRISASRDWAGLNFIALVSFPSPDWTQLGLASASQFQPYEMMGGRAALALALCDMGNDCGPNSYASRSACLEYGACSGGTLSELWRNALERDGLPSDLFDRASTQLVPAITFGIAQTLGMRW